MQIERQKMRKKLSNIDTVLERFEQIEAESAKFTQMLEMLNELTQRLKGFEKIYYLNEASFRKMYRTFQQMENKFAYFSQQHREQTRALTEIQKRSSESIGRVETTLGQFEQSVQQRATKALKEIRKELETWKEEFEQKQFSKLDQVLQTYKLIEMRVKSYETRINEMEKSWKGVTNELEQARSERDQLQQSIEKLQSQWRSAKVFGIIITLSIIVYILLKLIG